MKSSDPLDGSILMLRFEYTTMSKFDVWWNDYIRSRRPLDVIREDMKRTYDMCPESLQLLPDWNRLIDRIQACEDNASRI